jgi:hypothetical protein
MVDVDWEEVDAVLKREARVRGTLALELCTCGHHEHSHAKVRNIQWCRVQECYCKGFAVAATSAG